jgi:hypothetical protein
MQKCLRILALLLSLAVTLGVLHTPPVSAKDKPGKHERAGAYYEYLPGGTGTCSITCSNGQTYDTDATTVVGCACDCADVCGERCVATDGTQTRQCG